DQLLEAFADAFLFLLEALDGALGVGCVLLVLARAREVRLQARVLGFERGESAQHFFDLAFQSVEDLGVVHSLLSRKNRTLPQDGRPARRRPGGPGRGVNGSGFLRHGVAEQGPGSEAASSLDTGTP